MQITPRGYVYAAIASLVVAGLVAWWVHEQPGWGQPVESAGVAAAALLTAVTAVAAATSADRSRRAAEDAREALDRHYAPEHAPYIIENPAIGVELIVENVPHFPRRVRWTSPDGEAHERRFDHPGVYSVPLEGCLANDGTFAIGRLEVVVEDAAGRQWRYFAESRAGVLGGHPFVEPEYIRP